MKKETIERIRKFTSDRNWDQFHSPANLSKGLSIEASELLECFLWDEENFKIEKVKEELADVIVYAQYLLDAGYNIGILENDFGAVNVDMMLLQDLAGDNCELEMVAGGCDADCHRRRFKTKSFT